MPRHAIEEKNKRQLRERKRLILMKYEMLDSPLVADVHITWKEDEKRMADFYEKEYQDNEKQVPKGRE